MKIPDDKKVLSSSLLGTGSIESKQSQPKSLEEFVNYWQGLGYKVEQYGERPNLIIFGEDHSKKKAQRPVQSQFIRFIDPQFILHEFLNGFIYNPHTGNLEKQNNRKFARTELLMGAHPPSILKELSQELGFKMVGCDLTEQELDNVTRKLDPRGRKMLSNYSDEVQPYRDDQMVKTIKQYRKDATSENPVICILGNNHIKQIHNLRTLQDSEQGYLYVSQLT